jgi:biotin operon repressor
MLQKPIPLLPEGAEPINEHIAIYCGEGEITFLNASNAIFKCSDDDQFGIRLAQGILCSAKAVKPAQLAKALGMNRSTVWRNKAAYEQGGAQALLTDKSSNRSGYKLTKEKLKTAQRLLDRAVSVKKIGETLGVTEGCIRYAIRKGTLARKEAAKKQDSPGHKTASQRSIEDCQSPAGIGVKREAERTLACLGKLDEAAPVFSANESVRYAGVFLALPVLAQLGLLDVAKKVYGSLRNGFYGLQATLLTLAFMSLLRIKSPEQLKEKSPGELGIVLGLDRAPEVKTLRRKLKEMGLCCKSAEYMAELTRRWCDDNLDALGFIYIDGHVRPYHGRKHKLPKTHVARRRLCMPATTDFWVNDENSAPLFLITAKANDSLLSMIDSEVIFHLKTLAGDRRVTLIFDREGWSPKLFAKWYEKGVDVITYRKGKYDPWPEDCFIETCSRIANQPVTYHLGERSVKIGKNFWMREVRRLCDSGHQTSVMTTRQDLVAERIASKMFFRWTQENFFRYMRHEYNLDHLLTYDVEAADVERLVPCPKYKEKSKAISRMKADLAKLEKEYGQRAFENKETRRPTMRGFNIANAGYKNKIRSLQEQIEKAKMGLKQMPQKVPLKNVLKEHEIVRLEKERKYISDVVKMACYRSETSLLNLLSPHFVRSKDEGRAFLKSLFQLPADILPDEQEKTLTVRFHPMANPRSNKALKDLCEIMNTETFCFPQTSLKMVFEAHYVASEIDPCQEL